METGLSRIVNCLKASYKCPFLDAILTYPYNLSPAPRLSSDRNLASADSTLVTDITAAQEKMDFALGWFADPIYLGHYPESMVKRLGDRLPQFSKEDMAIVQGSSEVRH